MSDQNELEQVEQLVQNMAQKLHQNEVTQAKMVYWSIHKDKQNLSQEQFEDVETLLALVHGENVRPMFSHNSSLFGLSQTDPLSFLPVSTSFRLSITDRDRWR